MKIWKTKSGEKIDAKEFAKRFKEGLQSITPLQRLQHEQRATFIMLVGYLIGLVSLIIFRKEFAVSWFTYALMIIFVGAAYGQGIKLFALMTQLKLFKDMGNNSLDLDKVLEGLEEVPMDEGEGAKVLDEVVNISEEQLIDIAENKFRKEIDERRLKEDGNNDI